MAVVCAKKKKRRRVVERVSGVHCLVQVVGEDLVDKGTLETHERRK